MLHYTREDWQAAVEKEREAYYRRKADTKRGNALLLRDVVFFVGLLVVAGVAIALAFRYVA